MMHVEGLRNGPANRFWIVPQEWIKTEGFAFKELADNPRYSVPRTMDPPCLTPCDRAGRFHAVNISKFFATIRNVAELPHDEFSKRLIRLEPAGTLTGEEARRRCGNLFRGGTLRKHALEWKNPTVGSGGKSSTVRGMQWRLVMAYSGYEQIENAVFVKHGTARNGFLEGIQLKLRLPGPILGQRALDRLEGRNGAVDELCEFLAIQKSKRARFAEWLLGSTVDGQCDNERVLFIVAQLRHLVAHGALFADRADRAAKLGLVPCFENAPSILSELAAAIVNELVFVNPTGGGKTP